MRLGVRHVSSASIISLVVSKFTCQKFAERNNNWVFLLLLDNIDRNQAKWVGGDVGGVVVFFIS